ncbi:MFS general substrate transporter [Auriculariales sp. MPI-PUGE-AT-0066]|nr:MFS general substrate transporter [Auriculariales sp. MPI-PUGE-AT-0066]
MGEPRSRDVARQITLWGSVVIAVCSGTNYVPYGPQLAAQLHITHTQLNIVVGVYTSGPLWGKLVDSRGPLIPFTCGLVLLSTGYLGIRCFYEGLLDFISPDGFSGLAMFLLLFFSICTGLGGNASFTAAVNATAKSFQTHLGTTTALVLSGFGLSAFLFSAIAHTAFPGDTSSFLLLLALGTSLPMLVGIFFVRPVPFETSPPLVEHGLSDATERLLGEPRESRDFDNIISPITVGHVNFEQPEEDESQTPLLASEVSSIAESELVHSGATTPKQRNSRSPSPARGSHLPLPEAISRSLSNNRSRTKSRVRAHGAGDHGDVYGTALLKKPEFWLLFAIMSLLSGTGIMWINNVGSIAQALYAHQNPTKFPTAAGDEASSKLQATQVSFTSLGNCAGRIIIGVVADIGKNRFGISRPFFLCGVAAFFIFSQLAATRVEDPDSLWLASAVVGLSYGGMFGLCPVIVIEWFGLGHFSMNWGMASLSPLFGGNIFSLAFGRNLDAHAPHPEAAAGIIAAAGASAASLTSKITPEMLKGAPIANVSEMLKSVPVVDRLTHRAMTLLVRGGIAAKPDASHQCMEGNGCYVDSLYMTAGACTVAFGLTIWAALRDRERRMARDRRHQLNA